MGFCDQISIETACSATEANKSIGISDIASTGPPEGEGVGWGVGWGGVEQRNKGIYIRGAREERYQMWGKEETKAIHSGPGSIKILILRNSGTKRFFSGEQVPPGRVSSLGSDNKVFDQTAHI